jgi:nitronate monooxygenase
MRTAAAKAGDADGLSLWAGQGVGMVRPQPAAELFARLVEESEQVLRGLSVD